MLEKKLLWVAVGLWTISGEESHGRPNFSSCQATFEGISCPNLSLEDQKEVKRLCEKDKISLSCGTGKCNAGKTDVNCASDCKGGHDYAFEKDKGGSYNGRTWCPSIQLVRDAKNEEDVVRFVKEARAKNLPIKAVGASHTDNAAICTSGMVITTKKMKRVFQLAWKPDGTRVVRSQVGVTVGELGAWLHDRHHSMGYAPVGYHLVSLAGVLGTGAHGSSPTHSSILADYVYSMRMVLADGKVQVFSRDTTGKTDPSLWNALRVNLGMFGILTEVEIQVEDDFLLRVKTDRYSDETLYSGESIWQFVKDADIASASYFPPRKASRFFDIGHKGRVIVHVGHAIHKDSREDWDVFNKKADPGARFALHAPQVWNYFYGIYIGRLHKSSCDNSFACSMESLRRHQLVDQPPFVRFKSEKNHTLIHDPKGITGFAHVMQNSGGSEQGMKFRQTDWEVAVPFPRWAEAFSLLRDYLTRLQPDGSPAFCLPLMGVYIRFTRVTTALMSHAAAGGSFKLGDPVMFVEIPQFLPSFDLKKAEDQRLADQIMTGFEANYHGFIELMLENVEARVHWAKNRHTLFQKQMETNPVRRKQLQDFNKEIWKLDPTGVFSNEFMREVGIQYPISGKN